MTRGGWEAAGERSRIDARRGDARARAGGQNDFECGCRSVGLIQGCAMLEEMNWAWWSCPGGVRSSSEGEAG